MNVLKKSFFVYIGFALLLSCLYFFTRLFLLKNLPIFVDEVTYIHWAQLGFYDANMRLTSLGDGKQPLFIWLIILIMQLIHNPVIAGRVAAIVSGFGASIGLLVLTHELFRNKWIALLSMLLYILCPFALITDRRAIYDSLVTMLSVWSLYCSVLLVRRATLGNSFLLGVSLGCGLLNKSSGFISIYILPFTLLLFDWGKHLAKRFTVWVLYILLAIGVSLLMYSVLFLSSDFSTIATKNELFLNSPKTLLTSSVIQTFSDNISLFSQWIFLLITPFFLLLIPVGFLGNYKKEKLLLFLTFFVEIVAFSLLAKDPAPRYIFFMTMNLIPIVAYGLWNIYEKFQKRIVILAVLLIGVFSFALYSDYKIFTDIEYAPIPAVTKWQIVTGWPAGVGVSDIIKYLLFQSQKQKILVITDGVYGSLSTGAMDVYFFNNAAVDRMAFDIFSTDVPNDILEKAKTEPVYLFINQLQTPPPWNLKRILTFKKGHGSNYVSLYQLVPHNYE